MLRVRKHYLIVMSKTWLCSSLHHTVSKWSSPLVLTEISLASASLPKSTFWVRRQWETCLTVRVKSQEVAQPIPIIQVRILNLESRVSNIEHHVRRRLSYCSPDLNKLYPNFIPGHTWGVQLMQRASASISLPWYLRTEQRHYYLETMLVLLNPTSNLPLLSAQLQQVTHDVMQRREFLDSSICHPSTIR